MTPKELSEKAHEWVAQGAVLLDVRTPEEFWSGHPEAAVNIPVQELEWRMDEVGPPGTRVVVYCRSGMRSAAAEVMLRRAGFPDVLDLQAVTYW